MKQYITKLVDIIMDDTKSNETYGERIAEVLEKNSGEMILHIVSTHVNEELGISDKQEGKLNGTLRNIASLMQALSTNDDPDYLSYMYVDTVMLVFLEIYKEINHRQLLGERFSSRSED